MTRSTPLDASSLLARWREAGFVTPEATASVAEARPYRAVQSHPGNADVARVRELLAGAERPFVIVSDEEPHVLRRHAEGTVRWAVERLERDYFDAPPIQPEKVKTFELGFRTTLFNSVYVDAGYYYSFYNDFIGYNIGIDSDFDPQTN